MRRALLSSVMAVALLPFSGARVVASQCDFPPPLSLTTGILQTPWEGFWDGVEFRPARPRLALSAAEQRALQRSILQGRHDVAAEMLHGSGRTLEARAIEAQLEHAFLRFSGRTDVDIPGRRLSSSEMGSHQTHVLSLPGGMRGIFKALPPEGVANEVLAYRLDRTMGSDLVPVTVPFVWNGTRGSLQLFVDLPTSLGNSLSLPDLPFFDRLAREFQLRRSAAHELLRGRRKPPEIQLLDALIANPDRHANNWLEGRGFRGRLRRVAIDHDDHTFQSRQRGSDLFLEEIAKEAFRHHAPKSLIRPEDDWYKVLAQKPRAHWYDELIARGMPPPRARAMIADVDRAVLEVIGATSTERMLRRLAENSRLLRLSGENTDRQLRVIERNARSLLRLRQEILAFNPLHPSAMK